MEIYSPEGAQDKPVGTFPCSLNLPPSSPERPVYRFPLSLLALWVRGQQTNQNRGWGAGSREEVAGGSRAGKESRDFIRS